MSHTHTHHLKDSYRDTIVCLKGSYSPKCVCQSTHTHTHTHTQFSLESSYKELCSQLDQRKGENRQLVRDLEREQRQVSTKEKEIALLETQLKEQENKHRLLIEKVRTQLIIV